MTAFSSRRTLLGSAIAAGLALSIFALFGLARPSRSLAAPSTTRTFENPLGGCQLWTLDIVHLTAHPNQGATYPNALVKRGTLVQLIGTAERQQRQFDCSVTYTPLPFVWSATFQANDGSAPVNATGSLANTSALTPTLNASGAGAYTVQLFVNGGATSATVIVDTVDDGFRWVNIGPDGRPAQGVGRVNAIAFAAAQAGTMYVGTANGGVWRSDNNGGLWRPLMDNKGIPSLAIGALAVAPNGMIYAGTGDPNTFRDNDRARAGGGIYVSTDGGTTWSPTGTGGPGCTIVNSSGTFENAIRRIIIDPNDASTLYVAGDAGVYRSTNGGTCWSAISSGIPAGQIIDDLALNSLQLLAISRVSGVYATAYPLAGTPAWSLVRAPSCPSPLRGALAASGSYVYAAFGCKDTGVQVDVSAALGGAGSWAPLPLLAQTGQLDYNLALAIDPASVNRIYQGVVDIWRYQGPNGAWLNWNKINVTPNFGGTNAHSDFHTLLFDPNNPNMLYAGTDGGVYRFDLSGSPAVSPTNWTALNTNLAISQFRTLGVNSNWPEDVAGGLQDNGTPRRLGGRIWSAVPGSGGDGYAALYDASNPIIAGTVSPFFSILYVDRSAGDSGDLIRSNPQESNTPIIAIPNEAWIDPYRTGVMLATSPGTGMAGNPSQLYYGTNATSALSMTWTCIDPTPNTADQVKSVGFARLFPAGSGGLYYVGLDTGRIYLVDVQSAPATFANCASGSALRSSAQPIFTPTVSTVAAIDGIAEDPNRPCRIYATSTGALDQGYRVLRVEGTITANGCAGPWVAQPIASLPNTLDGLPNTLYGNPFGLHRWAVAVDPLTSTLVYVGTYAGLYQWQNVSGNWQWTRVLDVPDVLIVDIKAQVNAAGPFGTLFAATFGRGVYERVASAPSQTALSRPATLANEIIACRVRALDDLDLQYRVADVEVDYTYNGDHGDHIHLRPAALVDGVLSPYFVREIVDVVTGTHTANMQLIYGAADEPLGLATNRVQVEMLDSGGSIVARDCEFSKTWRRPDARTLEVRAEDLFEEGESAPAVVPITVTLPAGISQVHHTPFTVIVTQGASITLQAPVLRTLADELRVAHYWTLPGHAEYQPGANITVQTQADIAAVIRYVLLEDHWYLPSILR